VGSSAGSKNAVTAAINSLAHRGPDDQGYFTAPGVELGMARLAIIDVAHGQQPKQDSTGKIEIVFNGEIYNHREVQEIVRKNGGKLAGDSEAEALAELYKIKGEQFVNELRGMFAIAIWDGRDDSLLLARDRIGEKPLLYCETTAGNLVFASEMRAIFAFGVKSHVDESQIGNFLRLGYLNSPETIISGVKTLPPAHLLKFKDGKANIIRYWQLPEFKERQIDKAAAMKLVSDALENAVVSQMSSERPLGTYLSGGIDSTLVTAFAVRNSTTKINTFSIGFEDQAYDESNHARSVANFLGTDHHEIVVKPDPELILRKIEQVLDQPFGDSSIIPTFLLNEFASKEVIVALGGDGGDESMGGYDRYRAAPALQKLNPLIAAAKPLTQAIDRFGYGKLNRRGKRLLEAAKPYGSTRDRYLDLISLVHSNEVNALLHPRISSQNIGQNPLQRNWDLLNITDESERARVLDLQSYLPGDLLFKTDISSMANSLELRAPFLDYKYLEIAHLIPTKFKIHNGEGKHLLREIARTIVPAKLIDRPKMGFAIPRALWLRGPIKDMAHELLLGKTAVDRGWVDTRTVKKYWLMHQSGRDYDRILWPVLMLELWARNWVDQAK
jgi:asparagine synthase (glutamine-hydrolysing)